jgi:hypothetical protein
VARAGLSGVSAGACQCQSRCPPGHRDWLPSRTCHWQSRWAATSGSESGASGRHRSSLLRHLDVQVRYAYKLDHRPGAAASRLRVDLRHWHLRHGGRFKLLRHGQADCAVPVRPLARGIWRLQAWSLRATIQVCAQAERYFCKHGSLRSSANSTLRLIRSEMDFWGVFEYIWG